MAIIHSPTWSWGWRAAQIILRDILLTVLIILGMYGIKMLLQLLGIQDDLPHDIHYWYSIGLLVFFPVKSVWEILSFSLKIRQ